MRQTKVQHHNKIRGFEMKKPFEEMNRVLKPGGKLVIIDMEATEESLRKIEDAIETMRDFSHVKNRSKEEFLSLYKEYGYEMIVSESTPIPVELSAWMKLTNTSLEDCQSIIDKMENEIMGNGQTGFFPYRKEGKIYFNQHCCFISFEANGVDIRLTNSKTCHKIIVK